MNNYIFEKIDFSYGTINSEDIIYAYGVNYDSIKDSEKSLFNIAWHGWTVEEAQMIIDESKKLKEKEIYDYIVEGSELRISVDKEYVYFFDWRTELIEEDFNWTFNEFIEFMETFKIFIRENT